MIEKPIANTDTGPEPKLQEMGSHGQATIRPDVKQDHARTSAKPEPSTPLSYAKAMSPPESPVTQKTARKTEASNSTTEDNSSGDWISATAYWSELSPEQRKRIERDRMSSDDEARPSPALIRERREHDQNVGADSAFVQKRREHDQMKKRRERDQKVGANLGQRQTVASEEGIHEEDQAQKEQETRITQQRTSALQPTSAAVADPHNVVRLAQLDSTVWQDSHHSYVTHRYYGRQKDVYQESVWRRARDPIGQGVSGVVYREDCVEGTNKAAVRVVKTILKLKFKVDYSRELEAVARFSAPEYQPFFTQSHGWYEDDVNLCIVMEYVRHGDLFRYVKNGLPEEECRTIVLQVLQGLQFMHDAGYVHRDLKPQVGVHRRISDVTRFC